MGQTIGRAPLLTPPRHFVNLPKTSVYELWEAFNDIAEGFGLTVAEAMLKGTPVVASAVGGIVDQVIDGETGRLIQDPNDLEEFGVALCEILDDDDLCRRLGEGGRARALETHLGDTHLKRWLHVVNRVLADE